MNEGKIRGYSVMQQADYIEKEFDAERRERTLRSLPVEVAAALPTLQPAHWYPRAYSIALLRAIAAEEDSEQSVYDRLVHCGRFIANEATNTYLKLLMKILTPTLFAKKVPDFWQRDQQGGRFEVDVSKADDGQLSMLLRDVEGFDHIGIVSIGWITFGMGAIGKPHVKVEQTGWSLTMPGPREISYAVSW